MLLAGAQLGWLQAQLGAVPSQIDSHCPGLPPACPSCSDRAHPVGVRARRGGRLPLLGAVRSGYCSSCAQRPPWEHSAPLAV